MFALVTTLLTTITLAVANLYSNLGEVVFSHVLFRHGSRMPLEFYANDPYKDSPNWPFRVAQLTDIGKKQEYELGQWLRERYGNVLSDRYDPDEIYVQSTDVDRTLMSAQCVMGGLYPHHFEIGWEPVPVHTVPNPTDCVLSATSTCPCPAFNAELKRVECLPDVQALEKKFEEMYKYVSNHTGNEIYNFTGAIKIYDALSIEEEYNMSLPQWAHAIYPEPIREAALYSFVVPTWTRLLQKLKIGPLLKEMVGHFRAKQARTLSPDRKVWFYSAHDATISAFLNTLKAFDIHFPPFSACVILELRRIEEQFFVTLFYRNSTVSEPQLLPILACSTVCPLDQFLTLVQPLLPQDWTQECQLSNSNDGKYFYVVTVSVSVIIVSMVLIVLTFCLKKRNYSRTYLTMPSPYNSSNNTKINSFMQQDFVYQLPQ